MVWKFYISEILEPHCKVEHLTKLFSLYLHAHKCVLNQLLNLFNKQLSYNNIQQLWFHFIDENIFVLKMIICCSDVTQGTFNDLKQERKKKTLLFCFFPAFKWYRMEWNICMSTAEVLLLIEIIDWSND